MPSFKTPTQRQIETAIQRLRSPELAVYFFSRLENPNWVTALKEKGIFATPPPPVPVESGGVRFPHWPASKYLARMAQHVPSEVAAIFAGMDTDNESIIGDILESAMRMPAQVAATLVPVISLAIGAGTLWLHFEVASDLCVRLAEGGELHASMTLADALFEPKLEKGREMPNRRDDYWYQAGLKKVVPVLTEREPREFLKNMC